MTTLADIGTMDLDLAPEEIVMELPEPGDPKKVEDILLEWCDKNVKAAQEGYSDIYNRIGAVDALYTKNGLSVDATDQANELEQPIIVPESINQATTIKSAYSASIFQNGDMWRAHAINGELPARAEATKRVVDADFRKKKVHREIRLAVNRFVDLPQAGIKVCAERYTEREQSRKFFSQEQIAEYEQYVSGGAKPYGMVPTESGDQYMAIGEEKYTDACFYLEAINPRMWCKSSPHRAVQECFSVHESHLLDKREIKRKPSFKNKDKIGEPNAAMDSEVTNGAGWTGLSTVSGNPNYPMYRVWETWLEPPWMEWIDDEKFTLDDFMAFGEKFGFGMEEADREQKWRIYHIEGRCILKCETNYLTDREMFPYFTASYFELDCSDTGKGFPEVIGDLNSLHGAAYNLLIDALRCDLYGSLLIDETVETSDEQIKALMRPKGLVRLRGAANKLVKDQIQPWKFGTVNEWVFKTMNDIRDMLRTYGIPDIMQGIGNSETATQDQINNQRGQEKVNASFRLFVFDCLVPAIEQCIKLVFANYTRRRYIEILGEDGNIMADRKYIGPDNITYKISVQPIASWDLASNNVRIQQLTGLLNILGRTMNPAQVLVIAEAIMTYMNLPQHIIDALKDQSGLYTDIQAEIETLRTDPNAPVAVNPMDNHIGALEAIALAIEEEMQAGNISFPHQKNVQDYIMQHHFYLQQQVQQMQQGPGMQQGSGRRGPQPPGQTDDDMGQARQSAQIGSPADQGTETNAGLTGTASLNA